MWRTHASQVRDPAIVQRCFDTLARDERQRMSRFATAELRHLYLVSHSLARFMLSSFASVAPETWQFARNEWGAPYVSGPEQISALRFSLSHSGDYAACAVTLGREIGLDLEQFPAPWDIQEIIREVGTTFSRSELADLRAQPISHQPRYFAKLWTAREAYVKARGTGLSVTPASFLRLVMDGTAPSHEFHASREPEDSEWYAWLSEVGEDCQQAVVVRRRADESLVIQERQYRFGDE